MTAPRARSYHITHINPNITYPTGYGRVGPDGPEATRIGIANLITCDFYPISYVI